MGWTGLHREKGLSHKEFFEAEFPSIEMLDTHATSSVFYAAARKRITDTFEEAPLEKIEVFALVFLMQIGRGHENFLYKDMDETMGPNEAECPARLLDLLTPTDSEYANEWRAKCRANAAALAAKPKVKPGDTVEFSEPIHFNDGRKLTGPFRFVKRSTFTYFGRAYNLGSGWKRRTYQVV